MTIDERIQRLEDLEAIRKLTATYAFHINKGWHGKVVDVAAMATIFTPDAGWSSQDMGIQVVGLEPIMNSLREATTSVVFSMHSYTNPIIEVAGDSATGDWLFWIASQSQGSSVREVFMSQSISYSRTVEGWRIQTVDTQLGSVLTNLP